MNKGGLVFRTLLWILAAQTSAMATDEQRCALQTLRNGDFAGAGLFTTHCPQAEARMDAAWFGIPWVFQGYSVAQAMLKPIGPLVVVQCCSMLGNVVDCSRRNKMPLRSIFCIGDFLCA